MAREAYSTGTITVTNGSATVTGGGGADFFTAGILAGHRLIVTADGISYTVAADATAGSPQQLTLSAPYRGTSVTTPVGGYSIIRSFTGNFGIPLIFAGDANTATINQTQMDRIDSLLGGAINIGASGTLAGRAAFDNENVNFVYYATDVNLLYILLTVPGGWSSGFTPFGAGPEGPQGIQGLQGIQGATGPQGDPGPSGGRLEAQARVPDNTAVTLVSASVGTGEGRSLDAVVFGHQPGSNNTIFARVTAFANGAGVLSEVDLPGAATLPPGWSIAVDVVSDTVRLRVGGQGTWRADYITDLIAAVDPVTFVVTSIASKPVGIGL